MKRVLVLSYTTALILRMSKKGTSFAQEIKVVGANGGATNLNIKINHICHLLLQSYLIQFSET